MATHSSVLAWRIRDSGSPSMGSHRVRHDWATELNWTDGNISWKGKWTEERKQSLVTYKNENSVYASWRQDKQFCKISIHVSKKFIRGNNLKTAIEYHWFVIFDSGEEIWLIYWHMFLLLDTREKERETETQISISGETLLESQLSYFTIYLFRNLFRDI